MTDFIAAELAVLVYLQMLIVRARRRAARHKDNEPPAIA